MNIIAIDPGTTNTGIVYMNERGILCAKTIHFNKSVKQDQDALFDRAQEIARQVSDWIADKPHEAVVIEGFSYIRGRGNAYIFQTPYICGYLQHLLCGENLVIQTSTQVLNPRTRGNMAQVKDELARGYMAIPDANCITNDHLRSAAVHGWYYLKGKRC